MKTAIEVIDEHIPSLTDEDEDELRNRAHNAALLTAGAVDLADCALRTCRCGIRIDGFYDYVDHLKEMIRKETA